MNDKTFELLEKLYVEFTGLKNEMNDRFTVVENRLTKVEMQQEGIIDKVTEAYEAINTLSETNDKQHKEIMNELKGDIGVIELAVGRIAK